MSKLPRNRLRKNRSGFTLIEVTLALAVALIGMLAVLGLLPQGMQSAREAADNTISATLVQDTFSGLRTITNSQANLSELGLYLSSSGTINLSSIPAGGIMASNFFNQSGFETNAPNAYYKLVLNFLPTPAPNLCSVQALVIWPALSAAPPNTNIFFTQFAAYQNP